MKTSIKALQNINGLSNLKTNCGDIKKSGKPELPTTAILELGMRRSERDRIKKELDRLKRRKTQLQEKLTRVEKGMNTLFNKAVKSAEEMRGNPLEQKVHSSIGGAKMKHNGILEY